MLNYIKVSHCGEDELRDGEAFPLVGKPTRRRPGQFEAAEDGAQQDSRHFDTWLYFFDTDNEAERVSAHAGAVKKLTELKAGLPEKRRDSVRMSIYGPVPWLDLPVVGVSPRSDRIEEPAAAQ